MSLTKRFFSIIEAWRPAFCKAQAFERAREHAVASITAFGTKTIASMMIFLGRDQKDHTADYRIYSDYKWDPDDLFNPLIERLLSLVEGNVLTIGADDTRAKKTGKKIPFTSWQVDPMGPPFQVNLMWGLRFLQFSGIIPLYKNSNTPPRAIPIRFVNAPAVKKPGKKATPDQVADYKKACKEFNLSVVFVRVLKGIRQFLDQRGYSSIVLRVVVDGSFCNKTCMNIDLPNIEIVARTRKNARLCFQEKSGKRNRFYSKEDFTPESVRKDDSIPWQKGTFHYGGTYREIRYKEVTNVLWKGGTKRRLMRLIVVAPIPYHQGGRRYYRQPGYLLTTDLSTLAEELIQSYLDRWQIEVNFKEEKSILGVGKAQVWNERSVSRQPAFVVASYSALLLASIGEFEDQYRPEYCSLPKWRKPPRRLSCRALKGRMRKELIEDPSLMVDLDLSAPAIATILSKAA